jgi:tryptophan synthase alpha chain
MSIQNPESKIQNRIEAIFTDLRAANRRALMPFVTAGYPSLDVTEQLLPEMEKAGASVVELGIPFSDPIADGPVIAASMHAALQAGVTPAKVFSMVKRVRPRTKIGIVAMVSDSIITRMGPERFVTEASAAGFDGLIVPDLDLDAAQPLAGLARIHNLTFTLLIAPTTSPHRIAKIAALCTGFIYLLARVGITGERDQVEVSGLSERIAQIRSHTDLPVAVGFGISRAEHVKAVTHVADAAIVGSALVRRMGEANDPVKAASDFVRTLATGLT